MPVNKDSGSIRRSGRGASWYESSRPNFVKLNSPVGFLFAEYRMLLWKSLLFKSKPIRPCKASTMQKNVFFCIACHFPDISKKVNIMPTRPPQCSGKSGIDCLMCHFSIKYSRAYDFSSTIPFIFK